MKSYRHIKQLFMIFVINEQAKVDQNFKSSSNIFSYNLFVQLFVSCFIIQTTPLSFDLWTLSFITYAYRIQTIKLFSFVQVMMVASKDQKVKGQSYTILIQFTNNNGAILFKIVPSRHSGLISARGRGRPQLKVGSGINLEC